MDQSKAGSRPRPVGARPLPLAEAIERLQSPDALESFSVLTGAPVLAVDCRADAPGPAAAAATNARRPAAAAVATAHARLAELACPSVAIADPSPAPELAILLERFDVLVTAEPELTAVLDAIASRPLAA